MAVPNTAPSLSPKGRYRADKFYSGRKPRSSGRGWGV